MQFDEIIEKGYHNSFLQSIKWAKSLPSFLGLPFRDQVCNLMKFLINSKSDSIRILPQLIRSFYWRSRGMNFF